MSTAGKSMTLRETLRFCACCPNPCRRAIPPDLPVQVETETPSALSMIALAVIDGQLGLDAGVRQALGRTAAARACKPACPYGYDIAHEIESMLESMEARP